MDTIFDLVNSKAMAEYIVKIQSNAIPYLGEALFPNAKKRGLRLDWIVGYNSLPVALMPSAFDAKPTLRDRLMASEVSTKMPFFRESMRIGEEDRQELLQFLEDAKNQYAIDTIMRIFDDANALVEGAKVQSERMRMSILVDGKIAIAAPNDSGIMVQYNYDYDPEGKWAAENKVVLSGTNKWSDHENSHPITDILNIKRKAANHGVVLKKAILTTKTWMDLVENKSIRMDMNVLQGQNIIVTDTMLETYLSTKTGIAFVTYDKMYKDESKQDRAYYPDNQVTFIPDGTLGKTWYGTTPEEADLMGGNKDADVNLVNTGIALLTKKESVPVNIMTVVSEIVLPSFERMADVYNLVTA